MQLMPGESTIECLAGVTLTTQRVQLEINQWGSKKVTTITLDNLTSCDIESHSKPILLVIGTLFLVLAFIFQSAAVVIGAIPFCIGWFLTRSKSMVLRSASEKIERSASFGQWTELQGFIHKVQTAKVNQGSGLTPRQANSPSLPIEAPTAVQPNSGIGGADIVSHRPGESAIPAMRPPFWTVPSSFTFDSSALSASGRPATPRKATDAQNGLMMTASPVYDKQEEQEPNRSEKIGSEAKSAVAAESVSAIAKQSSEESRERISDIQIERLERNPPRDQIQEPISSTADTGLENSPSANAATVADVLSAAKQPRKYSTTTLSVCIGVTVILVMTAVMAFMKLLGDKPQSTSSKVVSLSTKDQESIRNTIDLWVYSFRNKETTAHVECYAPVVETYFRRRDVSRASLQRDKERAFTDMASVRRYDITDIQISPEPDDRAAATFHKDWDTSTIDGRIFAGSEIEKLTFEKYSGKWEIVKEEELKILHVVKGTVAETNSITQP